MEFATTHQLNYGSRPPFFRRWLRWFFILTLALVVVLSVCWIGEGAVLWCRGFLEGREVERWYVAAANHLDAPTVLKYSNVPAETYGHRDQLVDYRPCDSIVQSNHAYLERAKNVVFVHQLTTPSWTGVVVVIADGWEQCRVGLDVFCVSRSAGGKLAGRFTSCEAFGDCWVDLTGIAEPDSLRLFAGQPDRNDPASFCIPYESRGRRGVIRGTITSPPRLGIWVKLSVEPQSATTQPSN